MKCADLQRETHGVCRVGADAPTVSMQLDTKRHTDERHHIAACGMTPIRSMRL